MPFMTCWPLAIFRNPDLFFIFSLNQWRRFPVWGHHWWNPFFTLSELLFYRFSSCSNNTHAYTVNLSSSLTLSNTFFSLPWHPLSFHPSILYEETATGVFPESCNYCTVEESVLSSLHISRIVCACVFGSSQLFSACSRDFHAVGPRHFPEVCKSVCAHTVTVSFTD